MLYFSNYAAPSGTGMPSFFIKVMPSYMLDFSNYAASGGPGMPIFSQIMSYYIDLVCARFFQLCCS